MNKLRYTFKSDLLFKMLFVQYPDLLKDLVAQLLGISFEDIEDFTILNPEMPPENLGDKFCRLDINMTVNRQLVDLEIQVNNEEDYPDRVLFYWARDFSTALPAGEDYTALPRTIVVSILNFRLFGCSDYHSFFQPLEVTRHTLLSDKMGLHFFELPKLPADATGDKLLLWLSLFKAETTEELEKIKKMEVPVMNQAINAYYTITASSEFRERERLFDKARHDEAQALRHAKREGRAEGRVEGRAEGRVEGRAEGRVEGRAEGRVEGRAEGRAEGRVETQTELVRNALKLHLPVDTIRQLTGLSAAEIEELGRQL